MKLPSACREAVEDARCWNGCPCWNGCGRLTLHSRGRFCLECLSGNVPLPCPALTPTDYLVVCALELAARGWARLTLDLASHGWARFTLELAARGWRTLGGAVINAEQADHLWAKVVEAQHAGG